MPDPLTLCLIWGLNPPLHSDPNHGGWFLFFVFWFLFFLFRAAPTAYGSSQARGQIRATAAGLHHSHSNVRSKPHLWPAPQPTGNARQIPDPLSKAILMDPSQIHFCWAMRGIPTVGFSTHCTTSGTPCVPFIIRKKINMLLMHGK